MKLSWIHSQLGHRLDLDAAYGAQCMDLIGAYMVQVLHMPRLPGNAVDVAHVRPAGLRWIANGPSNAPAPGDFVVWRGDVPSKGIGPFGHIAICVAADSMTLLSCDQNWPEGAPVALVWHDYEGVAGWQHPI